MSNFTPLVKKEYDFEEDHVTVTFSRLKRQHMLSALPALKKLNEARGDVEVVDGEDTYPNVDADMQNEAINDMLDAIVDVLPKYVKEFDGLKDKEGNPVRIDTVAGEFYFLKLAVAISMDLMTESSLTQGKA